MKTCFLSFSFLPRACLRYYQMYMAPPSPAAMPDSWSSKHTSCHCDQTAEPLSHLNIKPFSRRHLFCWCGQLQVSVHKKVWLMEQELLLRSFQSMLVHWFHCRKGFWCSSSFSSWQTTDMAVPVNFNQFTNTWGQSALVFFHTLANQGFPIVLNFGQYKEYVEILEFFPSTKSFLHLLSGRLELDLRGQNLRLFWPIRLHWNIFYS